MKEIKAKKGFTIIEVILVLAIAGLIFLMVFIALPALQRGQRDTQRRNDISRVLSQVNSFQTNNRGEVPQLAGETVAPDDPPLANSNLAHFLNDYLMRHVGEFNDPQSGNAYGFRGYNALGVADGTLFAAANDSSTTSIITFSVGARCSGENVVGTGGLRRSVAVRITLEGAGSYCQDNQ